MVKSAPVKLEIKEAGDKILCTLARFHLLTADLLIPAVGSLGSATTVHKNLLRLSVAKYIYRFPLATKTGKSPLVCVLGERGVKYLREERELEVAFYRKPSEWDRFSSEWLIHPLELNKFLISANLVGKLISLPNGVSRILVTECLHDFTLKSAPLVYTDGEGNKHGVIPDALLTFGIVRNPNEARKKLTLWIELERNSHREKAFTQKFKDIYHVIENRVFDGRFGGRTLKVCFVSTIDMEHVEKMRRLAREELLRLRSYTSPQDPQNLVFHFGLIPSLQQEAIDTRQVFLSDYWLHPLDSEETRRYPLIRM